MTEASVESIWRRIFRQAIRTNATDIHIEPQTGVLLVRFRRQGALSTDLTLAPELARPLARQLKKLAGLDLKQTQSPQDSSFSQVHNHRCYHLSVATMPLVSGERIVVHIHDPVAQPPELAALGLWGKALAEVQNALTQPYGLILFSGPNHSGVSTTLASCSAALISPLQDRHIASVEEKTAYHVTGVSYMPVKPSSGMTWPRVLRLQLKHDFDAVILGNIPDRETAEITIEAARRQRLILSGIRADHAVVAIRQLMNLSGNPLELAASLRLVCAQRLAPRLCPDCREVYVPDSIVQKRLALLFHLDSDGVIKQLQQLEQAATDQGLGGRSVDIAKPGTDEHGVAQLWRARVGGCQKCHKSGYAGAIGLFEVMSITDNVRNLVASNKSISVVHDSLLSARTTSLVVDGLIKALVGLITIETVLNL